MSDSDESDIIVSGRRVPFVQVGMIVHPDDCLNCERDGHPLWCSALVCDIRDDDEIARFGMMATLLYRSGERREEPCNELRRRWRLARDFDQSRVYTGRWGAIPRGSVWPVAEINDEAEEWIERAGVAERRLEKAEEVVELARILCAYDWQARLDDSKVSDDARSDARELSIAVWLYDQTTKKPQNENS